MPADKKADDKIEVPSAPDTGAALEVPDDSGDGEAPVGSEGGLHALVPGIDMTGGPEVAKLPDHIQQMVEEPPELVCPDGAMDFEGKCVNKDKVDAIIDKRKEKAIDRVQKAKSPKQKADATYDLLEQNTAQAEKMEDDLDEILEQLKEEKKAGKKKGDL